MGYPFRGTCQMKESEGNHPKSAFFNLAGENKGALAALFQDARPFKTTPGAKGWSSATNTCFPGKIGRAPPQGATSTLGPPFIGGPFVPPSHFLLRSTPHIFGVPPFGGHPKGGCHPGREPPCQSGTPLLGYPLFGVPPSYHVRIDTYSYQCEQPPIPSDFCEKVVQVPWSVRDLSRVPLRWWEINDF